MDSGQLFTWDALSALAGASLFTFFVVSYFKVLLDKYVPRLPTDIFALIVAWTVLILAQLALGASAADWRLYALAFANAFLVAAAAGQMHNKALSPPGQTKGEDLSDAVKEFDQR